MKQLEDFIDGFEVITAGGDGGDSCANEGTYWMSYGLTSGPITKRPSSTTILEKFEVEPGTWVRHPDRSQWYGETDRLSADQARSLLTAIAAWPHNVNLGRRFAAQHLKRGLLFMTNTRRNGATKENHGEAYKVVNGKVVRRNYNWKLPDVTGPEFWALLIRACRYRKLRFILPLLDASALFSALWSKVKFHKDVRNRVQMSLIGVTNYPTAISRLAARIYLTPKVKRAILDCFDSPTEPPLGELLVNAIEQISDRHSL